MSEPRRLHSLTLLFEAIRVARSFIVPALVGGASFGGGDFGGMLRWALALMALPALLGAAAKYASFRYRLGADEFVLDSGVLSRSRRVIPLVRIQHIDIRQSALQRLTGVAELRVETAGGDQTEAVLTVLALDDAESLRTELLDRRRAATADAETLAAEPPEATLLARLGVGDLALAGATANEVGFVAALLGGAFNLLLQLEVDIPMPDVEPDALMPVSPAAAVAVVITALVVVFVVAGWIFSIAGSMLRYHGFTLERTGEELRKRFGLLGRQEAFIPLRRVQTARVEESLLRRRLRLAALKVETAGGSPGARQRGGAEAFLPLARVPDVPGLIRAVFEDVDYGTLEFHRVHPRARLRAFYRYAVPLVLLVAGLAAWRGTQWLWLLTLLPAAFAAAHLHYRHLGYALAPGYLVARSGFLNRITWVVPERKIQTLHVRQTPFQRRHGLASLIVDTAAGQAAVRDLHQDDAARLQLQLAAALAAHL
jgi:putative membrane protein